MKAKDAAAAINQAVEAAGVMEKWEEVKRRLVAGQGDAELQALTREIIADALRLTREPAQDYLHFLSKDLGTGLAGLSTHGKGKSASYRAKILAADQAWRAFHHRLNPASQHVTEKDALKEALHTQFPSVYRLGWGFA